MKNVFLRKFDSAMDVQNLVYLNQLNSLINKKYESQLKLKLHRNEQKFVYEKEILKNGDDKYLIGCCRNDEPVRTGMQIFIKTIDDKILAFDVQHSNKIRDVKMKILEKIKLSTDQQNLFFQGEILDDDDKIIDEYQIHDQSVIDIVARLRGGMQIFAKTVDGKSISFEVHKSNKIIDIKYKIQEKLRWSPDEQKLIYQGVLLEDNKTIDEYGITDQSVINFVVRLIGIQIFARTLDGRTVTLVAQKSDKIIDIKQKYYEKTGLHPNEQILSYQLAILIDDKTIDEYKISDKSVINVVAKLRGGRKIFTKSME